MQLCCSLCGVRPLAKLQPLDFCSNLHAQDEEDEEDAALLQPLDCNVPPSSLRPQSEHQQGPVKRASNLLPSRFAGEVGCQSVPAKGQQSCM